MSGARILYGISHSGHAHRVELLLRMLKLPYEMREAPQEVRQEEAFLRLNPLRQIPVLQDGDLVLCDSCAILVYLVKAYAPGTHWLPEDAVGAAEVQRWLAFAAGELKYGPAAARRMALWNMPGDKREAVRIARTFLTFMNGHLEERIWLATGQPTIADLACYAYVAHAPEGGIDLTPYPAVRVWLQRVQALPGFFPMPASPLPAPAPLASTGSGHFTTGPR
ncbi:glutathione S-transferase [Xanthobacter sp. TB0139]|uniref:glutathione S-transferase n=1 Tax=Xanthobacter sp. TB0139 TaxID=3459178 RepID=UPI004039FC46